jgi:hypothetical protein
MQEVPGIRPTSSRLVRRTPQFELAHTSGNSRFFSGTLVSHHAPAEEFNPVPASLEDPTTNWPC